MQTSEEEVREDGGVKVKRLRWGHSGEKTSRGMTASRLQGCEARWLAGWFGGRPRHRRLHSRLARCMSDRLDF